MTIIKDTVHSGQVSPYNHQISRKPQVIFSSRPETLLPRRVAGTHLTEWLKNQRFRDDICHTWLKPKSLSLGHSIISSNSTKE